MKVVRLNTDNRLQQEHAQAFELYNDTSNELSASFDGADVSSAIQAVTALRADDLERQNITRWEYRKTDTDPQDIPPVLPWLIPFDNEVIKGDVVHNGVFICQSAGYYNIKCACDIHVRTYNPGWFTKVQLLLIKNNIEYGFIDAHYYNDGALIPALEYALVKFVLSGADKIKLEAGDTLFVALQHDGGVDANTRYINARVAMQRTGDIITNMECCNV